MANKTITLTFNINEHGRLSHSRNYDVRNVRAVLESAATRERISMREAYGYYGHGRRQIAGKLSLWNEYFNTSAMMTDEEFHAMSYDERLKMLVDAFGEDEAGEDVE